MTRARQPDDGVAHVLIALFVALLALAAILAFSDVTKSKTPEHPNRASPPAVTLGASVAAPAGGGPGAVVVDVRPGGPAQTAGVVAGDLLASIDGRIITSPADIATDLAQHHAGDTVILQWFDGAHVYHGAGARLTP